MNLVKLVQLLWQETLTRKPIERVPEPTLTMNDAGQVQAFHQQGMEKLIPIYQLNALATNRMTPKGGTVLDLGSGSAQYLAYLAQRRPDLKIIGIELAPDMITIGHEHLKTLGLTGRVELRLGDMTQVASLVKDRIDTISSIFSLHHLPSLDSVRTCMQQMYRLRQRDGSAILIFDYSRPHHPASARLFPKIFTPNAAPIFNEDSRHSLIAAFTFDELRQGFASASLAGGEHALSRWMRLFQIHTFRNLKAVDAQSAWVPGHLSFENKMKWKSLQTLFPSLKTSSD